MERLGDRLRPGAATLVALVALGGASAEPSAGASAPLVEQLVVFKGGKALQGTVRAAATTVQVGRRRCGVALGTPMAALVRSKPGRIGFEDFGSCSRRTTDSGQLYVRSIRGDREGGNGGWVYKVGRKLGTAGAADPGGPFGRGRLRSSSRVTWFYCFLRRGSCQRTLELKHRTARGGRVTVTVRSYDDEGRGRPEAGATVSGGGGAAATGPNGVAVLALRPGRHLVKAAKAGVIRSFGERVTVP